MDAQIGARGPQGTVGPPPDAVGAQLSELADSLVEEISAARRHLVGLQEAVRELEGGAPQEETVVADHAETPGTETADRFTRVANGADLVALNMALSGASREETREHLKEVFEISDPEALLDDAYGVTYSDEPLSPRRRRFGRRLRGG